VSSIHSADTLLEHRASLRPPTPRQREILAWIKVSTATNGFSPTIREIGLAVGLSSASTTYHHLIELQRKGFIRRHLHSARTITLVEPVA
jgi:repressor LexA